MSMVEKRQKVVNENKMMVNMTKEALYDFLLFHAYSKFSGFLVNILGLAVAFMGIFSYTTGRVSGIGRRFIWWRGNIPWRHTVPA